MVHPNAKSLGKYSCYCQFKRMLTLKEKTAVDLSEPPPEVQLLRLLCLPPREAWGECAWKWTLLGIITTQRAALAFFPLENLQGFSLLSDHDKRSSDCSDFWDCRGLGLEVNRSIILPLEHLLAAFCPIHMNHTCISWKIKEVLWETVFFHLC